MTASAPRPTGDDVLKLVEEAAAVERAACIALAEEWAAHFRRFAQASGGLTPYREGKADGAEAVAAQIRARGNTK